MGRFQRSRTSFQPDVCRKLIPLKTTVSSTNVAMDRRQNGSKAHTELEVQGARGPFASKINGMYEHDISRQSSPRRNMCHGKKIYYRCNNQLSPSQKRRKNILIRCNSLGYWIV